MTGPWLLNWTLVAWLEFGCVWHLELKFVLKATCHTRPRSGMDILAVKRILRCKILLDWSSFIFNFAWIYGPLVEIQIQNLLQGSFNSIPWCNILRRREEYICQSEDFSWRRNPLIPPYTLPNMLIDLIDFLQKSWGLFDSAPTNISPSWSYQK